MSVEDASIGRAEDQSEREFSMLQALRSTRYRTLGVALTDRQFKPESTHTVPFKPTLVKYYFVLSPTNH